MNNESLNSIVSSFTHSQDKCLSFEIGTEYGSIGFLHTREEARGKGLAKAVIGRLAEEYCQLNQGLYACVVPDNEASYSLHSSLGFKDIGHFYYALFKPSENYVKHKS